MRRPQCLNLIAALVVLFSIFPHCVAKGEVTALHPEICDDFQWGPYRVVTKCFETKTGDDTCQLCILSSRGTVQRLFRAETVGANMVRLRRGHPDALWVHAWAGCNNEVCERVYVFILDHGIKNVMTFHGEIDDSLMLRASGTLKLTSENPVTLVLMDGFSTDAMGNLPVTLVWHDNRYVVANRAYPHASLAEIGRDRQTLSEAITPSRDDPNPQRVAAVINGYANSWMLGQQTPWQRWAIRRLNYAESVWYLSSRTELDQRLRSLSNQITTSRQKVFDIRLTD